MSKHILDVLSIAIVGLVAVGYLVRTYFKMRKNKCATICSGCSRNSCNSRSFANYGNKGIIKIVQK